MPKIAIPLIEAQIAALAPRDRQYKVSDGHGLYLLVDPTGTKRWRMSFHLHGRESTLTLGDYPETPLSGSRQLCIDANRLIGDGIDPVDLRRQERKHIQPVRSARRKFHLSMDDLGGMVIETRFKRMTLTPEQVATLRAFLIAGC